MKIMGYTVGKLSMKNHLKKRYQKVNDGSESLEILLNVYITRNVFIFGVTLESFTS